MISNWGGKNLEDLNKKMRIQFGNQVGHNSKIVTKDI
jgi:hypothetical protein